MVLVGLALEYHEVLGLFCQGRPPTEKHQTKPPKGVKNTRRTATSLIHSTGWTTKSYHLYAVGIAPWKQQDYVRWPEDTHMLKHWCAPSFSHSGKVGAQCAMTASSRLGNQRQNTDVGCDITAPTVREKDASVEALMEKQDWEHSVAAGVEEPATLADSQESVQAPLPPIRGKAALSNLRQALPSGVPLVKYPHSGGATS